MNQTLVERLRARKHSLMEQLQRYGSVSYQRYLYIIETNINRPPQPQNSGFSQVIYYAPLSPNNQPSTAYHRSYTLVNPNPKIYNIPPRMIGLPLTDGSITLSADDIICDHVNRGLSEGTFTEKNINHFVIAEEKAAPGQEPIGIRCRLIHIDSKSSFGWRLILRKLNDRDRQ